MDSNLGKGRIINYDNRKKVSNEMFIKEFKNLFTPKIYRKNIRYPFNFLKLRLTSVHINIINSALEKTRTYRSNSNILMGEIKIGILKQFEQFKSYNQYKDELLKHKIKKEFKKLYTHKLNEHQEQLIKNTMFIYLLEFSQINKNIISRSNVLEKIFHFLPSEKEKYFDGFLINPDLIKNTQGSYRISCLNYLYSHGIKPISKINPNKLKIPLIDERGTYREYPDMYELDPNIVKFISNYCCIENQKIMKEFIDSLLEQIDYIKNTYLRSPSLIGITEFDVLCNFIEDIAIREEYIKKFSNVAEIIE